MLIILNDMASGSGFSRLAKMEEKGCWVQRRKLLTLNHRSE